MKQYQYVEDYLELIAGYTPNNPFHINPSADVVISLARYDVEIINSMAAHTIFGGALTDRQGELSLKIVTKYQRQLAKNNIDISPVLTNPLWRMPLRKINRTREIWVDGTVLRMRFPYNKQSINDLHSYTKTSNGRVYFDPTEKIWNCALTETNVFWAVAWGKLNNFEIDESAQVIYENIQACESQPYAIELVPTENGYTITNAADSLTEYINDYCGGFGPDNLTKLIDMSAVMGYTISPDIDIPLLLSAFNKRITHLTPSEDTYHLDMILEYAKQTNRWPVCIFDPAARLINNSLPIETVLSQFSTDQVIRFDHNGKTSTDDYNIHNVKVVYARKIPKTWDHPVPLLVSTIELMLGGKRMEWLQSAEKVIFYCAVKLNN